jgi:hypothetical protein
MLGKRFDAPEAGHSARVLGRIVHAARRTGPVIVCVAFPPMSSGPRSLASWKEIAHYLGVNVRTAQKWETERALPINRVAGPRSRVSAEPASLDAWKQQLVHSVAKEEHCYSWPLGPSLTVEVRFVGAAVQSSHIELLCEYLGIAKTALTHRNKL